MDVNVPALVKFAVAAGLGAAAGSLLFGGFTAALVLAVLAVLVTWGARHGLLSWLREIPQRFAEWRTERESAAFGAATAAAGIAPAPAAPAAPAPAALPRPRRGKDGDAPGPVPAAGGEGVPPRESDPGFSAEQADLMHAITSIVNRASNGDVIDVRRAIKILAAAGDNLGAGTTFLGTRLAEPDKHYGPEIWEPTGAAGAHFRAGALQLEVADAMTTSLLQSTVGELAVSPRQAPHHSQLNGGT